MIEASSTREEETTITNCLYVLAINKKTGAILFLRKKGGNFNGFWSLPGGKEHAWILPQDKFKLGHGKPLTKDNPALIQEILEECGKQAVEAIGHGRYAIPAGQKGSELDNSTFRLGESIQKDGVRWITHHAALALKVPFFTPKLSEEHIASDWVKSESPEFEERYQQATPLTQGILLQYLCTLFKDPKHSIDYSRISKMTGVPLEQLREKVQSLP